MSYTDGQIVALSHRLIDDRIDKGIFSDAALLRELRAKQKVKEGGRKIDRPLIVVDDTGSVGGFYSSGGALSLQAIDNISSASADWRYAYENMTVTKPDLHLNGMSKGAQYDLLEAKVTAMFAAFEQRLTKSALSAGGNDAGGSPQFDGFEAIIQSTGSYGGITPAQLSQWAAQEDSNSGVNRSLTLAIVNGIQDLCREGSMQYATHAFARAQGFTQFRGLLSTFQRTVADEKLDGFGHDSQKIAYGGMSVCIENQCQANTMYLVDLNNLNLYVGKTGNMRKETLSSLETSDALVQRVFMYANLLTSSRRAHGRIDDISE